MSSPTQRSKEKAPSVIVPIKFKAPTLPTISEEPSSIDHQVLLGGGTTSRIERLPSRLQRSKNRASSFYPEDEIKDLVFENSYLRAELSLNEEYRQVLLGLKSELSLIQTMMDEALNKATKNLRKADQRYLQLHGIENENWESGMDI